MNTVTENFQEKLEEHKILIEKAFSSTFNTFKSRRLTTSNIQDRKFNFFYKRKKTRFKTNISYLLMRTRS